MSSCFSIVSLYSIYLRRIFLSSGLRPQTIQIDSQTTLHCWLPPSPSKPPLLLIHGFGLSAIWQWRFQIPSLSRHFSLYVPDLVFFGGSTTSSPDRSEIFQAVSLAKMMEKLGVQRFSVLGTSYGGFVAYHLGRICGDRLEKIVIASSGVNKRWRDNEELMEKAGMQRVSNLLLPATAAELRTLLHLSVRPWRKKMGLGRWHWSVRRFSCATAMEEVALVGVESVEEEDGFGENSSHGE